MSLGVLIDLSKSASGCIAVSNKPGRLDELVALVAEVKSGKEVGFKEALGLRGKISFAESNLFGRVGAAAGHILAGWARTARKRPASVELVEALEGAVQALLEAPPRRIRPIGEGPVEIVFLDGAVEDDVATVGGVLFGSAGKLEHFGLEVPAQITESWKSKAGQTQTIGQAEIFPALVARLTWQRDLEGRKCVFFIDNESARLALVKQYSPVLPSLRLLMQCSAFDVRHGLTPWYARVPTASNIADGPSRMISKQVENLGSKRVDPVLPDGVFAKRML